MDFIGYFEYKPEDFDKIIKLFRKAMEAREKDKEKFPKMVYGPVGMAGGWKGFTVYKDPTQKQMNSLVIHYMPYMTFKFISLTPASEMIEQYLKEKK